MFCTDPIYSGHNQSVAVTCVAQFQPSHNASVVSSHQYSLTSLSCNVTISIADTISLLQVCNNGTWSRVAKCVPAKCTELPDAPRNGMVVAPNLDHGMVGKFEVGS